MNTPSFMFRTPSRFDIEHGRTMHATPPLSYPLILIASPCAFCPHLWRVCFCSHVGFFLPWMPISANRPGIGSSSSLCTRAASHRILGCLRGMRCPRRIQSRSLSRLSIGQRGIRIWGGSGVESISRLGLWARSLETR